MTISLTNASLAYPLLGAAGSYSLSKGLNKVGGVLRGGRQGLRKEGVPRVSALTDLSIKIEDGDRVGIIGHNGAGKSSLLKLIAGIYTPTSGSVDVKGNICSLLDLNTGYEPDLSGRENVVQKLRLKGFQKREAIEICKSVEEFCELGDFFELPIRSYSTGMFVRLSFAVATCLKPDILVLDEMLSAGDASFIEKAQSRLGGFIDSSRIIILASHDMNLLVSICNKGLLLNHGSVEYFGDMRSAVQMYSK